MVAVLEVPPEQRPALSFVLARLIPMLRRGAPEDQEVAAHLAFALHGLDEAPGGPGEIEFVRQDLYALGTHLYAVGVDLEEYWRDRRQLDRGRMPAEKTEPEVAVAAARYFPEIEANPEAWTFKQVEPALIALGFKLDALMTAEAPRARGLYNKARAAISRHAIARREKNAEARGQVGIAINDTTGLAILPAASSAARGGPVEEHDLLERARPAGTALLPARHPDPHLSLLRRASYPPQYEWGVETETGINADDLEPNRPVKVNIGGTELMLVNVAGSVCAVSRICTHRAWDLSGGMVEGGVVTCGLHGARYNVCSGEVVREPFDPEFKRQHFFLGGVMGAFDPKKTCEKLTTYPTIVDDNGDVRIHI